MPFHRAGFDSLILQKKWRSTPASNRPILVEYVSVPKIPSACCLLIRFKGIVIRCRSILESRYVSSFSESFVINTDAKAQKQTPNISMMTVRMARRLASCIWTSIRTWFTGILLNRNFSGILPCYFRIIRVGCGNLRWIIIIKLQCELQLH